MVSHMDNYQTVLLKDLESKIFSKKSADFPRRVLEEREGWTR